MQVFMSMSMSMSTHNLPTSPATTPTPTSVGLLSDTMSASPEMRYAATPETSLTPIMTTLRLARVSPKPTEENEEGCRTPTSEESKIPTVTSCPPPPKKLRMVKTVASRRRLFDAEFIKVSAEEIDRWFRRREASPLPPPGTTRKRKRCCFDWDE